MNSSSTSILGLNTCCDADLDLLASHMKTINTHDSQHLQETSITSSPVNQNDIDPSFQKRYPTTSYLSQNLPANYNAVFDGNNFQTVLNDHGGLNNGLNISHESNHFLGNYSLSQETLPYPNNSIPNNISCNGANDSYLKPCIPYSNSQHSEFSDISELSSISSGSESCHNLYQIANTVNYNVGTYSVGVENLEDTKASILGPGLQRAVRGRPSIFYILTSTVLSGKYSFKIEILDRCGNKCSAELKQITDMKVSVRYKPDFLGLHEISVFNNSLAVDGSPVNVNVVSEHEYQNNGQIKYTVEGDEQKSFIFNDPWGISCNKDGIILVADRGNHTIRVFTSNFSYSYSIGSKGSKPGELNKPAGLDVNSQDQIVVADKDNHRIQIFTLQGEFISVFGDKGSAPWQFNYPWSVSIAVQDSILVSDSRNGRISMFSSSGTFMRLIVEGNTILKNPRGIYYREIDKRIITADMNKHQIIVIETQKTCETSETNSSSKIFHPSCIGGKGKNPDEFNRPHGVTCDLEGNIIVCDSKNGRLQFFDLDGNYLTNWTIEASDPAHPAEPKGICVTPWGSILVVDSKYNRVIVY